MNDALAAVKYIKTLLNRVYCIITIFVSLQKIFLYAFMKYYKTASIVWLVLINILSGGHNNYNKVTTEICVAILDVVYTVHDTRGTFISSIINLIFFQQQQQQGLQQLLVRIIIFLEYTVVSLVISKINLIIHT